MKKIILTPNPYRDKDFQTVREAIGILTECDFEVRLCLPFEVDRTYDLPRDLKFHRLDRELLDAAKEVLLVPSSTTGQNGLIQAKQFKEIAGVTAMAITKLDGTAKGGIVIAVSDALQIPVKFVGVGEQADDLMPFVAEDFVKALIGDE